MVYLTQNMDTQIMKRIFFGMLLLNILIFFSARQAEANQQTTAKAKFTITLVIPEQVPTTLQEAHRRKNTYKVLSEHQISSDKSTTRNYLLIAAK